MGYYDPYEFDIATNIKLFHIIECLVLVLVLVFFGCKKKCARIKAVLIRYNSRQLICK